MVKLWKLFTWWKISEPQWNEQLCLIPFQWWFNLVFVLNRNVTNSRNNSCHLELLCSLSILQELLFPTFILPGYTSPFPLKPSLTAIMVGVTLFPENFLETWSLLGLKFELCSFQQIVKMGKNLFKMPVLQPQPTLCSFAVSFTLDISSSSPYHLEYFTSP